MKFKYFLVPMLALFTCGTLQAQTSDATSSPTPGYDHHDHAWIWKKLNLTDSQKQDIKQYRATNKTAFRSALASYFSAKQGLLAAIKNNESTQSAAATLATAEANLLVLRVKQEQYMASLLTGDQVTTWQNFQNERANRMQKRINKLSQASP
jgi:Spy/CpxP family protein refolding chaperone